MHRHDLTAAKRRRYPFVLALIVCLGLAACGSDGSLAPEIIENAVYDSAADASGYGEYFGIWEGLDKAKGDTLEVHTASGGLYFTLYAGDDLVASGYAQTVPEYECLYFFNQHDGHAYRTRGGPDGMTIETFGTFVMKIKGDNSESVDDWYGDGKGDTDFAEAAVA